MLKIKQKTGAFKIVVPWDEAIDLDQTDMKAYLSDLDFERLKFKDGVDPCIIHLCTHSRWIVQKLLKFDSANLQASVLSCFRFSIEKIENVKDCILSDDAECVGDSSIWVPEDEVPGPSGTKIRCIGEEDAIALFNIDFVSYIANITQIRSAFRKGAPNPYQKRLQYLLPTAEKME